MILLHGGCGGWRGEVNDPTETGRVAVNLITFLVAHMASLRPHHGLVTISLRGLVKTNTCRIRGGLKKAKRGPGVRGELLIIFILY